jgi:hypothetical protein
MQNLRLMLIAIVVDLDSNGRNNAHRTVKVLVNDLDPNGNKLALASVTQPQNGAVAIIGDRLLSVSSHSENKEKC